MGDDAPVAGREPNHSAPARPGHPPTSRAAALAGGTGPRAPCRRFEPRDGAILSPAPASPAVAPSAPSRPRRRWAAWLVAVAALAAALAELSRLLAIARRPWVQGVPEPQSHHALSPGPALALR